MNEDEQSQQSAEDIIWITLKEAARLVGCSVKTVRRRIDSGKWRSIIEYRGRKAIRLVARPDALSETSILRLRERPFDSKTALSSPDELSRQLGQVLDNAAAEINREFSRQFLKFRLYLIILAGVGVIVLFLFLSFLLPVTPPPYPDTVLDNQRKLAILISADSMNNLDTARRLADTHNRLSDLQEDSGRIKKINARLGDSLEKVEEDLGELENELNEWRNDKSDEFHDLRKLIVSMTSEKEPGATPEPRQTPSPPPSPLPKPDQGSGFLGIF